MLVRSSSNHYVPVNISSFFVLGLVCHLLRFSRIICVASVLKCTVLPKTNGVGAAVYRISVVLSYARWLRVLDVPCLYP